MITHQSTRCDTSEVTASGLLTAILAAIEPLDFAVRLWNGTEWAPQQSKPNRFTLVFNTPGAIRSMFCNPGSLSFGEAFIFGEVAVEGSLAEVFEVGERLMRINWSTWEKLRLARDFWSLPLSGSHRRSVFSGVSFKDSTSRAKRIERAVNYHYDHPVEFWKLWLDEKLVYSCAYFEEPDISLSKAQLAKLDYICRKLRLQPGQRFLDMGCGWGALVVHATSRYGVEALGVTMSPQQAAVARQRIADAGLEGRCRVEVGNFLELDLAESFDCIASIGAAEHVPESNFGAYFSRATQLLKPGGQFLHHAITRTPTIDDRPGPSFMDKYVFPDHYVASIGHTLKAAEDAGFEVRDVENLREHYATTLRHWLKRLDASRSAIEALMDPITFRVFQLYLAGSAYEFKIGRLAIHQTLLVKTIRGDTGLPATRTDWYLPPRTGGEKRDGTPR